jgi:hypothetical protein
MTSNHVEPCSSKSGPGGLNMLDDMTLAYMVNTSQYEKYLKKNHIDYDSAFKRDIRFYRKRIVSLTKDLFKEQFENDKNQNVLMGAFNIYMRACISYLKFSDQSDTIQKCYVCLGMTDTNGDKQNKMNETINNQTSCVCKNKNENDLFELHKANELCFQPKEVKKITLDNYVIRKNVKKSEPVVYPQQFTFNPRDPAFKHKGLKSKIQSRSQSTEKIRIESINHDVNQVIDDNFINIENGENGENGENNVKDLTEKLNEKRKKKKKKKMVSFDVTNYIDNI